jgi:hypothetical protein
MPIRHLRSMLRTMSKAGARRSVQVPPPIRRVGAHIINPDVFALALAASFPSDDIESFRMAKG